jgi:hypothetical protein
MLSGKDEILANFAAIKRSLFDTAALETERRGLQNELAVVVELIQKCIAENARAAIDQITLRRFGGAV